MAGLADILDKPISWHAASTDPNIKLFLEDFQANILKGHGRHHAAYIFIGFKNLSHDAVAHVVRTLGRHCTSAANQLRNNKRHAPHLDGGTVSCFFLSAGGFKALGPHAKMPAGAAFAAGMAARQNILTDPAQADWDATGWKNHTPDAMILLANTSDHALATEVNAIMKWLATTGCQHLMTETGLQQTRKFRPHADPEGVEHFGYVDGRSQPLFLQEDINLELASLTKETPNPFDKTGPKWSPEFKPSQFIVADPNGQLPFSAGSYFVFRKLEQDVRGFNAAEDAFGKALFGPNATQDELDRAGAMVVGRFEDGTPLTAFPKGAAAAVPNGFTYAADADGDRCPFHAHIRKTNPRGDVQRQVGLPDDTGDRAPIMARRGITYGPPRPMNAAGSEFADKGKEPVHGSGLLFMAYMADLEKQFEFTQQSWANNPDFAGNIGAKAHPPTGIDPVIGQASFEPAPTRLRTYLDGHTPKAVPSQHRFELFVHMKGGEYFFAPSLSFLRSVGAPVAVAGTPPISGGTSAA